VDEQMKIATRNFGEIDVLDNEIVAFDEGLPGFPDDRRFVLLTEDDNPVCFLQSVDNGAVSFVVADMIVIQPGYNPHVDEAHLEGLGEYNPDDFLVLNICTVNEAAEKSTVNLKAPIVINAADKKGKQVICSNDDYHVNAPLFEAGTGDNAEEGEVC